MDQIESRMLSNSGPNLCRYNALAQIGPTGLTLGCCCRIESEKLMLSKSVREIKYMRKGWKMRGEKRKSEQMESL